MGSSPNSRCQTAHCCSFPRLVAAPGFVRFFAGAFAFASSGEPTSFGASGRRDSSNSVPPMRGDGAPTGALFRSVAPATRDHHVPGRPGPLSALHRGGFRPGPTRSSPAVGHRSRSDCPRHAIRPGGRGPDLPAVRFAPRPRDATPGSVFRIVSRKRPLRARMQNIYYIFVT